MSADQLDAVSDIRQVESALRSCCACRTNGLRSKTIRGNLVGLGFRANLVQFSAAHESRGVHRIAHLQDAAGHYGACATRQFGELGERLASRFRRALRRAASVRGALHAQPYQEDALVRVSASGSFHSGRQTANANSCEKRELRRSEKELVTEG